MYSKEDQLMDAIWDGDLFTIHSLISLGGVDINMQDEFGKTPLMGAAASCSLETLEIIMDYQPDLEIKNNKGETALNFAIFMDNIEGVKLLIAAGANIETVNNSGKTPLIQASRAGLYKCVEILIAAGANIKPKDNYKMTAIDYANHNKHKKVAELLSKHLEKINRENTKKHRCFREYVRKKNSNNKKF